MSFKKVLIPALLVYLFISGACKYIVLPVGLEKAGAKESAGWSAVATNIGKTESGDLHIDLTIRNETGDWSAMNAAVGKPALLTSGGENMNCDTIFIGTGGHRLAPGFQMQGYIAGTKAEPVVQPIYVECAGGEAVPGSRLTIPYTYVTGQYNYYEQDKKNIDAKMEINLDEVVKDLVYPVAEPIDELVQGADLEMVAINKVILTLTGVQRTDDKLQFAWNAHNPSQYPTYVHIGIPPVIGTDGVLYGFYETPDIVSVPITPASGNAEWTTEVTIPEDVNGLYIMLSVETGKARLFANYAIDITDQ
jgi:hypothetical protein